MPPMRSLTWPFAAVVIAFLTAITIIAVLGKDIAVFATVGLGVLGAMGLLVKQQTEVRERTDAVQQQTNGNMSRLLEMIERQNQMLAQMTPPLHQLESEHPAAELNVMRPRQDTATFL